MSAGGRALIRVKGNEFQNAVSDYIPGLKKAKKTIDVSHLPDPGRLSPKQGIALNQALSYVEAAVALMDKAEEKFQEVVGGSKGRKSK